MVVRAVGRRPELTLFIAAYLLYNAARWIFVAHGPAAREHAHVIIEIERFTHVAIEGSIQRALDSNGASWVLSNIYLVVLPGALIWLHRHLVPDPAVLAHTAGSETVAA